MRLSACSIVKNESENIARSIESYKDVVDEIIIVDTGSTDNTVEICRSLGAKVLHFDWINDFAAAKNFALEHATGDWVIFLDADEWFVPKLEDERIFKVLDRVEKMDNIGVIKTILCNVDEKTGFINSRNTSARIFRNGHGVRYVGKIHEDLWRDGKPIKQVTLEELEIYHSGYSGGKVTAKSERNLEILYDLYRQGQADTATYFYLCRENEILGKYDEALKFYELFFEQKDHEPLILVANIFVNIYENGILIKQSLPDKFTQADVLASINEAIEKYPILPKHHYLKGIYYYNSDYDEALACFLEAIKLHQEYKGPYLNSFAHSLPDAYFRMAQIYRAKHRLDKAFDYYVLSLQEQKLRKDVFNEFIQMIRDQPAQEIILFLNSIYDLKNVDHIRFLAKQLMMSRLPTVFLYYAMKYNREFNGQDETTYIAMILAHEEEAAVNTAMTAYFNAGKEDDRYYAALALMCSKGTELFEHYRSSLNPAYSSILNKFLNNEKPESPSKEEINAFIRLYRLMFYIGSAEDLIALEHFFAEIPLDVASTIVECYVSYKDHRLIIDKVLYLSEREKSEHFRTQMHKLLGFSYYFIRDYAKSVEYFTLALESKHIDIDRNIIIYLKLISEIETNDIVRHKALKLYESYSPIFEEYVKVTDILRTGKNEDNSTAADRNKLSLMNENVFLAEMEAEAVKLPELVLNAFFSLAEKYTENTMDVCAHNLLIRLLQNEYKKDILYYRLGEIYTRLHNPQMSLYCHHKAFEENAAFAETLIADRTNSNRNYIYRPLTDENHKYCPLCGKEAPLHSVYNVVVSSDFSPDYPPIKSWRYCKECRHRFTTQRPQAAALTIDEKEARAAIANMALSISSYAETMNTIYALASGKKMLDIDSGNGQFLAAALEYGFEPAGVEPSENLAALSSKVLDVPVHNCHFEDFVTAEGYNLIAMGQVLESMSDPKAAVKKVYELLHSGGLFYIETPNFDSGFARVMQDKDRTLRSARIANYFSRQSLESLLQSCGFQVLSYGMSKRNNGYMEIIAKRNV
ncbi:hypothetical protein AT727_03530 [Desulfitobacterium hafniense]|uniref:Glycosyltransferase 2-like domain-containing protein n=1 Tax=Desulfitobacterium hafniense TaxID=49338 RepID=A0A0W1JKF3_DESHA|nr:glycosyltransferase [Desulfitobacterium hafniense]KTE92019.1 hypothetical protein AT727_03530 [Desulfitobacterium hafniense]